MKEDSSEGAFVIHDNDLARTIYKSILDAYSDAITLGDFSRFLPFFHLPLVLETFEGERTVDTPEVLRFVFNGLHDSQHDLDIVEVKRTCSVAQFVGPDEIRAVHETKLIDRSGIVQQAYTGLCTMCQIDGQWQLTRCQFAEEKVSQPTLALRGIVQQNKNDTAAQ
ncbi:hypothetical protein [Gymnodinialimonas sp. 57CJ19]|uniref:hypothetical protein n=1 Tax=Gymnodinialimonas sp. 57CJ19 TaxID=3138498 RepID=UPI0031344269